LSVWDVVEQAGGIRTNAWPVGVTLYRPTSETGRASQFSWTLESAESARPPTEFLRPGDVVYVAPSAGARLKNAVGGLLRK
jgi:protein involved in polysaccharide export with SLBB domain